MSVRVPARAMTGLGHEDQFPPPRSSGRCGFREGTFAGTRGKDKDAPIPAIRRTAIEPPMPTLKSRS